MDLSDDQKASFLHSKIFATRRRVLCLISKICSPEKRAATSRRRGPRPPRDRNDIAPEKLEALKVDMVSLLKYLEIDEMGIRMGLRGGTNLSLVADIPLKFAEAIRGRKKNG